MQIRKRKKTYEMKLGKGEELGFYESKNCRFENGRLEAGVGVAIHGEFFSGPLVQFFQENNVKCFALSSKTASSGTSPIAFLLCDSGYVYVYNGASSHFIESDLRFSTPAELVLMMNQAGGSEVAVFDSSGIYTVRQDGSCLRTYTGKTARMGVFLHGRLYFSSEYAVHCTSPFSFEELAADGDNCGRVLVDRALGQIAAMTAYGEKLFVLQERGAFFLEGGGAFRDFTVKRLERLGGRAVENGVCVIGKEILYLCEDGLYKRLENGDGRLLSNRVEEIDFSLPVVMTAVGSACRIAFIDWMGNNRARIFSASDGSSYESFLIDMPTGKNETCGVLEDRIVRLEKGGGVPSGEACIALSYPTDFGSLGEKVLRKLSVCGRGEVRMTVRSERGVRSFSMQLIGGGEAEFALKGRRFDLEIELKAEAAVESVQIEYEEVEQDK